MSTGSDIYVEIQERMKRLSCCIIIPTYNNAATLKQVIEEARKYAPEVIVVNDGSTDETPGILEAFTDITCINLKPNKGKGFALKTGFRAALDKGYAYAITLDSDGQHSLSDIPLFLDKLEQIPGSLIIGTRQMKVENKPGINRFANKFSNFWFWVETGKKLKDTQCGFRLYPLNLAGKMKFFTRRYEFEIEILVRLAWKGIELVTVPVQVYYPPKEKRISHFRPFTDFARISLLNTILVLIALLLVKPFRFLKSLNRRNIREFYVKQILSPGESNLRKAISVAVGVFVGIIPIWGWQMATAITISVLFKLNKMITVVASNISIPPMIPLIIYASYKAGGLFIKKGSVDIPYDSRITLEFISENFLQYLAGSIVLAVAAAVFFGTLTFILLSIFRKTGNKTVASHNQKQP